MIMKTHFDKITQLRIQFEYHHTIIWIWTMFHMRFFSIGNHKKCKPNHYILLLPIFHDLEMIQFWSVNYVCLVYKLKFLFWTCLNFGQYSLQIYSHCIAVFVVLFRDCGNFLIVVFWQIIFQNLMFMFSCYPKIQQNKTFS